MKEQRCVHYQINRKREDFLCDFAFGHSSSQAHRHRDGTRWRMPGEKRGKLRPYGMPKIPRGKTK